MKPNINKLIENLHGDLIDFFSNLNFYFYYELKSGEVFYDTIIIRNDNSELYYFKYEDLSSVVEKTNKDNGRLIAKFNLEETRHFALDTITSYILKEMGKNKIWDNFKEYFLDEKDKK